MKPSASENAITAARSDDNKISEKNIKPEILMDLSRLTCDESQQQRIVFDEELLGTPTRPKRKLSRVSSDSACRVMPEVKFQVGGDDEPPSVRHSQTDLSTSYGPEDVITPAMLEETVMRKAVMIADVDGVAKETDKSYEKKWKR